MFNFIILPLFFLFGEGHFGLSRYIVAESHVQRARDNGSNADCEDLFCRDTRGSSREDDDGGIDDAVDSPVNDRLNELSNGVVRLRVSGLSMVLAMQQLCQHN